MTVFCPLLFNHLATHPSGSVSHCCVSSHVDMLSHSWDGTHNDKSKVYNLNHDKIEDLYNSDSFKQARATMLEGKAPRACTRCFQEEKQGIWSKRQEELRNYPNFTEEKAREITSADGTIEKPQFDFVELRMGNTCNVKCRTCNPASSSLWRRDYQQLENEVDFPITKYGDMSGFRWAENPEFWDDLMQHSDKVKVFYINGGEPMLIKEHLRFLERLVKKGHTNVVLWYNINMTQMNESVLDLWSRFLQVRVSASIDDIGVRNHYIRYPTEWGDVCKNLGLLLNEDWIQLDITQTVSWMNYTNVVAFWQWANTMDVPVSHNPVYDPVFMSPAVLPDELRRVARLEIEESTMPQQMKDTLLSYTAGAQRPELWKRAKSYTRALDRIRAQRIGDTLIEFKPFFEDDK